ncbi:hypothetical protein Tco_0854146 [Tanacetum coccineum]
MSTPVNTSSTDSQMHNNIMAAGSKDRPPMLGPGRYSQWRSRFLRYIDTRPNGGGLKKSILSGPYVPTTVQVQVVEAAEGRLAVPQHTSVKTILNMTPENKEHFQSEKEAIFLLLTGIGDEIYSTVDACNTANEMWTAIERLQQGESLNVQDVKGQFVLGIWEFTSRAGESMGRITHDFTKCMNELTKNNCIALIAAAHPYLDNLLSAQKPQRSIANHLPKDQVHLPDTKAKRSLQTNYTQSELVSRALSEDSDEQDSGGNKTKIHTKAVRRCCKTELGYSALSARDMGLMQRNAEAKAGLMTTRSQEDTDEEIDEQELEAHYSYMAKIQDVSPEESSSMVACGTVKEKSKVISDLKVKEEKDIDKMIEMDKQLKFLNKIVYTCNQSIQTIHMLAPKCSTYNGRPTFANPRYLKKAQSEKPSLYEIPYDTSDLANIFGPNKEETVTLANESR